MVTIREPVLKPVSIAELRPTQITLGMREVADRRKRWRALKSRKMAFLNTHMIPAILGPKQRYYIIDHHHLVRALHEEGVKDVLVTVAANLSKLDQDTFWIVLDNHDWMHPFDAKGKRRDYDDIPKSVADMVDDPFRSLAGELRRLGGYSDFIRRSIGG